MASECILAPCYKRLSRAVSIACLLGFLVPLSILSNTLSALPLDSQKNIQLPQIYTIEVVNVYPHDPRAFTEGLLYGGNNTLYESTGLYGMSTVRRVTLQTGKVEALQTMDLSYFGEGLTLVDERLYQLTYEHNTGFIYDRSNLSKIGQFTHQMADGWGLASDGKVLFGSDGSSTLYQIDPKTMKEIQRQTVRYMDLDVPYLNELEYVNGEVWANVVTTDCIVRISPEDGTVLGWILLPILRERMMADGEIDIFDILNGIAWDKDEQRIFVTGKCWPKVFEIKVNQSKDHSDADVRRLCIPVPASVEAMK
ncbi:glutaminyl-peptide cyclotransferase isoform X2 [Beta vulgaris subsp. vulgaris]|uniref:glutaminyl-peptide cyclotransferase isoform X2 n=1 Tax=Beta vulgaris subsp. vulgaris TaxID=3555 RepID=UPI0020374D83|nr:glutaminyl-peptide cyclotransferase isoform X2 [Beta vulgaris subsp. vulgaris]